MRKIKFVINITICFLCLSGCVHDTSTKQNAPLTPKTNQNGTADSYPPISIYNIQNNKFISFDTIKFQVPVELDITSANIYNGIYELRSDSLIRRKFLITKNLAFITTFEDLGQGIRSYLYTFDLAHKSLIRDTAFKRDYLYSSAGIFVIDAGGNKIFSIGKSAWYDLKKELITPASLFEVKGRYFNFEKNIYEPGELGDETPSDSSIVSFFKGAISTSSNRVSVLPGDWWQVR